MGCSLSTDPELSLTAGRPSALAKYAENFELLCTGESPTFQGKVLNKPGHRYAHTPIHRWVPGFVLQGGDVTRKDGSGGISVCESGVYLRFRHGLTSSS